MLLHLRVKIAPQRLFLLAGKLAVAALDILAIQHFVNVLRHPLRLQHHEIAQFLVFLKIENVAQFMQPARQHRAARHLLPRHQIEQLRGRDMLFGAGAKLGDGVEPVRRPLFAHERQRRGLRGDRLFQRRHAVAGFVADAPASGDLRIFRLQLRERQFGLAFVRVRGDEQHRRLRGAGLNLVEPVVEFALFMAESRIPEQHEQSAVREEKLVRGVVNLLAAEIPRIQAHGDARFGRVRQVERLNRNAARRVQAVEIRLALQHPQQRRFADAAFADQHHFRKPLRLTALRLLAQIGENAFCSQRDNFRWRGFKRILFNTQIL